ncbi:MAG: 3-dehydroquinate synthase [Candidatus Cloacimonetes bacterium]|nr:3-dehydroquinate synthase [Candidatus Cloacimonadota bacterium]
MYQSKTVNKSTTLKISGDLKEIKDLYPAIFIIDEQVYRYHSHFIDQLVANRPVYILEASEKNKTLQELHKIMDFFICHQVNRSYWIIAIGGGITSDISGFAASIYKRGCRLCFIPTTFLGMIDAALGGKTGINFNNLKNMIGSFYPAEIVLIRKEFLTTLPACELINGWAEWIKIALIVGPELFNSISTEKIPVINEQIILSAAKAKLKICSDDPYDQGIRRLLNLGHTFAHLLETLSDNEIRHGEAVLFGIRCAAYLSSELGYLQQSELDRIISSLSEIHLLSKELDLISLLTAGNPAEILLQDKKIISDDNKLNLVLIKAIGNVFIAPGFTPEFIIDRLANFADKLSR